MLAARPITDRTTDLESAVAKMIDLEKQIESVTSSSLRRCRRPRTPPIYRRNAATSCCNMPRQRRLLLTNLGPLTHRAIPMVENNIDPAYLKPGAGPPASEKTKTANNGDQECQYEIKHRPQHSPMRPRTSQHSPTRLRIPQHSPMRLRRVHLRSLHHRRSGLQIVILNLADFLMRAQHSVE